MPAQPFGDDVVDGVQSESARAAMAAGSEEWIECSALDFWSHAASIIGNDNLNVIGMRAEQSGAFHPAAMANVPRAFADFLDRQGSFAPVSAVWPPCPDKKIIHALWSFAASAALHMNVAPCDRGRPWLIGRHIKTR